MDKTKLGEVFREIERSEHEIVRDTSELVAQPSIAARHEGIEECASLVESKLRALGAKTEVLRLPEANPVVFAEINSSFKPSKTVLFYLHYDVQPPEPLELWTTPPFEATVRNGRIYGRGAHDDKGEIAIRLHVVRALLEKMGGEVPCNIRFLVEGEEEVGSRNLPSYVEKFSDKFKSDSIIWEFGGVDEKDRPLVTLGVKGILYVELVARKANKDLHSKYAAVVENPAWELVWTLSKIKTKDGDRIVIPRWYEDVRPLTDEEKKILESQPFAEEDFKKSVGISKFINDSSGAELVKDLAGKPTANIAGLISGYTLEGPKTVLPSEARAKMDFRLVPDQDPEKLFGLLESHIRSVGAEVMVRKVQGELAARTSVNTPIVSNAVWGARQVFDAEPIVEVSSPATGPMHVFAEVNRERFQCVAIGSSHPDCLPHSPDENQRIDLLVKGAKWIGATVLAIAEPERRESS